MIETLKKHKIPLIIAAVLIIAAAAFFAGMSVKDSTADTTDEHFIGVEKAQEIAFADAGAKKQGVNITLIDSNHRIFALSDETKSIIKGNYYVSVFAAGGECKVKLEGFYYNNDELVLQPDSSIGVSNEIVDDTAKITVLSGIALVVLSNLNM